MNKDKSLSKILHISRYYLLLIVLTTMTTACVVAKGSGYNKKHHWAHEPHKEQTTKPEQWHQYAVKFICRIPNPAQEVLANGRYFTAVNVHNPELRKPVDFWFKVAVAEPRLETGPISKFKNVFIKADGALEIDCPSINEMVDGKVSFNGSFRKGFVVIISKHELDIVAVYTAANNQGTLSQVQALHMERVPYRSIDNPLDVLQGGEGEEPTVCIGAGCCCNSPMYEFNPGAGSWPDCSSGFECRAMTPPPIAPSGAQINVNVCAQAGIVAPVLFIHSSQPSYCRYDVP